MSRFEFNIYTDGSYSTNESNRTYGGFVIEGLDVEMLAFTSNPTWTASRNVGGELLAVILALNTLKQFRVNNPDAEINVNFFYDYEGVGKWAQGQWKCNKQLTQGYKRYVLNSIKNLNLNVNWHWVKGHADNRQNNRVDSLVTRSDRKESAINADSLTKEIA